MDGTLGLDRDVDISVCFWRAFWVPGIFTLEGLVSLVIK
jgi:hypothetical protein